MDRIKAQRTIWRAKEKFLDVRREYRSRFEDSGSPLSTGRVYFLAGVAFVLLTVVCFVQPLSGVDCATGEMPKNPFANPLAGDVTCERQRHPRLLGLTVLEARFGRRIVFAAVFGALVGGERRQSNRGAGIRTNATVAIAAACFTMCSAFAFESGTLSYDASRSSAQIPAGVTFIASAVIFKKTAELGVKKFQRVSGLMTAAALWVSAAVGTAAGGGLFWTGAFCSLAVVNINQFGSLISYFSSRLSERVE